MGIAFLRQLLSPFEPVTIDHALNHFDHVRKLVGAQHLAVGSDLDLSGAALPKGSKFDQQPNFSRCRARRSTDGTYNWTVKGLDHPKRMFDLTDGLIRRGYNDEDIKLVLGGNAVRVLSEVWSGPPKPNLSKT